MGRVTSIFSVKEQNVFAFKWWEGQQLLYVTSNYYGGGYTNKDIQCNVELRNSWNHIALVRNGKGSDNLKIYINGKLKASATSTKTFGNSTDNAYIGWAKDSVALVEEYTKGYIDEFRVSNGIARWTSEFTPPNAPYQNIDVNLTSSDPLINGQKYEGPVYIKEAGTVKRSLLKAVLII